LELLSRKSRAALSRRDAGPDRQLLAQIATARDLGAPQAADTGTGATSGDEQGFATVVADTVFSGPGLALIGALGAIALVGGWTRSIRRRRSPADPS
jgi:hypothetical protein